MSQENLNERIVYLENKLINLEKSNENVLNSYNHLFNVLFIDYDLKPKGTLKDIQELCLELLDFIINICNKYNLNYWLDYGNLLGAMRHGGFVPWDDDMDIGMMRKDYSKFFEVLDYELEINNLKDEIRILKNYKDDLYEVPFTQISYIPKGKYGLYAGVDIFPYDFISEKNDDLNSTFQDMKIKFKKIMLDDNLSNEEFFNNYFKELNISLERTDYVIPAVDNIRIPTGGQFKFEVMDESEIFPLKSVKFNNKTYNCPNDSDNYLVKLYGNWREIPKVILRHGRMAHLKKVDKEIDKTFERSILKFKLINSKF